MKTEAEEMIEAIESVARAMEEVSKAIRYMADKMEELKGK